jgi:uncharacterized protein (DUF1697 family)
MPNYVAFLRAINVGGRSIKMPELAAHFETLGYEAVETFINTGNVVFQSSVPSSVQLGEEIETPIAALLGFKSEVFVRDSLELQAILATAEVLLLQVPSGGELNVAFLKAPLTEAQAMILSGLSSPIDQFLVQGSEVYWTCRGAQNSSKFSNGVFEQKLKLRSTFRRVSTLTQLSEKFFAVTA